MQNVESRTNTLVAPEKYSETEYLSFFTDYAVENNYSFALWRLPNQSKKHVILSQKHQALRPDQEIEELPTGFLFAPFDPDKDRFFLVADFSFSLEKGALLAAENPLENRSHAWLREYADCQKYFYNVVEPPYSFR